MKSGRVTEVENGSLFIAFAIPFIAAASADSKSPIYIFSKSTNGGNLIREA